MDEKLGKLYLSNSIKQQDFPKTPKPQNPKTPNKAINN
jgi:hypothetical protein